MKITYTNSEFYAKNTQKFNDLFRPKFYIKLINVLVRKTFETLFNVCKILIIVMDMTIISTGVFFFSKHFFNDKILLWHIWTRNCLWHSESKKKCVVRLFYLTSTQDTIFFYEVMPLRNLHDYLCTDFTCICGFCQFNRNSKVCLFKRKFIHMVLVCLLLQMHIICECYFNALCTNKKGCGYDFNLHKRGRGIMKNMSNYYGFLVSLLKD